LVDSLGFERTLADGHEPIALPGGRRWLLLGLGPDPAVLAARLPAGAEVRYVECPEFIERAGPDWLAAIPAGWRRVTDFDPLEPVNILAYRQALDLFPVFWAAIRARLLLPRPLNAAPGRDKTVLVPQVPGSLLYPALAAAFAAEGFAVRPVSREGLLAGLEGERPALFFSVNAQGLDRLGEVQAVLARVGVPLAVWCVDNPFHVLSGVKTPAWREAHLFVTDDWFVEPLRRHGARRVHHLPLAVDPAFWPARPARPELAGRLLFVGHSAFADKERFFAGLRRDPVLWAEALEMLARGERPHYGWWAGRLGLETLWPGKAARQAGFGAEETGLAWRRLVIGQAALAGRLAVCGDTAWRELVAEPFELLPPVPYGPVLAGMYASARAVVGTVSPLLPQGLTQRHFDVWAAGGCLLTDASPGLSLFPEELTRPITYARAQDIPRLARERAHDRDGLIAAWRELLAAGHTYGHRVRRVLEVVG
jgi:hypothetical protein